MRNTPEIHKSAKQVVAITGGLILLNLIIGSHVPLFITLFIIFLYLISETKTLKLIKFLSQPAYYTTKLLSILSLSFLFYFILTPVSIIWRIFTKDPLNLKKREKSYYILRNKEFDMSDFQKPY